MRKTIIFGAVMALFGLAAAAQASSDQGKPVMKDGNQITQKAETEGRVEKTEHKKGEHAGYSARERDGDAREKGEEAREREHKSSEHDNRD